jgi:hypothetical protein
MTTRKALTELKRAYVRMLEAGRDLLIDAGGACDLVDVMEKSDPALIAACAALAQPQPEPVGWFESPHGAFRANPDYRLTFPSQLLKWSVPVYLSSAAPPPPAPEQPVDDGSTEKTGTVPWPVVESYSGGADHAGIGGRVWLRMGDGPETVEYVPAQRPPTAAENAALQDAAEGVREQPAQWPEIVAAANKSVTGLGYPAIKAEQPALSDEQIEDIWADVSKDYDDTVNVIALARAIERALKGTP